MTEDIGPHLHLEEMTTDIITVIQGHNLHTIDIETDLNLLTEINKEMLFLAIEAHHLIIQTRYDRNLPSDEIVIPEVWIIEIDPNPLHREDQKDADPSLQKLDIDDQLRHIRKTENGHLIT